MSPLSLDPNELDLHRLKEDMAAIVELNKQLQESIEQVLPKPWVQVARGTALRSDPRELWKHAQTTRAKFRETNDKFHKSLSSEGNWRDYASLWWRAMKIRRSLSRVYLAAGLSHLHIVGVVDLTRDLETLDAWCA